jgi:N-acyl-D-aspartate/D-glutamate deacylase
VRDRRLLGWADAIAKTSYLPAKDLEAAVPQMTHKGRVQVGMDADLVAFDPATVQDQATYARPNQTSVGMRDVLVNGVFVIRDDKLDTSSPAAPSVARSPLFPRVTEPERET